ncbi:MAG: anthranilate phosphoribosyltransferase [Candidatus Omnitrophota bacterium]
MIKDAIKKVSNMQDLTIDEMEALITSIAKGEVIEGDIASFLTALARKKETADEITGAARAMRAFVTKINVETDVVLDTCGTGGDKKNTFNISTVSAFVVAGAGIKVAKHGNRSVSSACGSADLLEALGVNIKADKAVVEKCLADFGIGFLFAPQLHPAMGQVQEVRKKLKTRTIFNILGPLINPAFVTHQLLGVSEKAFVPILGEVLNNLELKHAMVVCGEGGYDEVITFGPTHVCEVKEGHLREYVLEPEKLGLEDARPKDIAGGDVDTNKHIASNILKGMEGPARDIVVLNAGCCIYLAGKAATIKEAMNLAGVSIDSGAAIKKLNKLIEYTNDL